MTSEIREALYSACSAQNVELVALSGGLDSSIVAHAAKHTGSVPRGVGVIARDFPSTDLTYCQMASNRIGVPLSIYNAHTTDILDGVAETIRILKNFNDIEIRNSVVMYLAIKWAADNGYRTVFTGDGADELFAGYSFLVHMPEERLGSEIERVCSVMHFTSRAIGEALGVSIVSPFLDQKMTDIARKIEPALKVRTDPARNNTRYGKWILRKAFEGRMPSSIIWRTKSAMQDGSGTSGLTELFDSVMDEVDFARRREEARRRDGVIIRSRESMYYYTLFRKNFGLPSDMCGSPASVARIFDTTHTVDNNIDCSSDCDSTQDKKNVVQKRCPYCQYIVMESRFCRMCAAFPI